MIDKEALQAHAKATRDRFRRGEITFDEAKKELKPFTDAFNAKAAEIAAKYNRRPKKLNVGEFLRVGFLQ